MNAQPEQDIAHVDRSRWLVTGVPLCLVVLFMLFPAKDVSLAGAGISYADPLKAFGERLLELGHHISAREAYLRALT